MTDVTHGSGTAKPYTLPGAKAWIPGESILGLLVRNTRPQGFRQPALLLSRIMKESHIGGLGVRHLEDREAQAFADLLGMPRAAFDLVHHGSSEPYTVRLFGHVVHAEFVSLGRRRVCPLCLLDSPHHRSIWDFSLLTVCPEHGVPLIDRCQSPKCSRIFTWATPSVTSCSSLECVASPVDAPSGPVEQRMEGVRHLVAAIMGNRSPETPDWPVNSIIRFTFDLGNVAKEGGGRPRPIGFAQKHPELMPGILDAGWKAIADWPHGFRSLMADLRAGSTSRPGRWGLKKEFGGLAVLLEAIADDPAARPLLDEFSAYVAADATLATRASGIRRQRSETGQTGRSVTANKAKSILGVTYTRVHALATLHGLWLVPPTGSGASSLICQQKLFELARRLAGVVTKKGAADILNTSKGSFRDIEALGLVRPIPEGDRLLPERLYDASAIREFLGSLEAAAAEPDTSGNRDDLVTPDMLARSGINIAEVLSAVVAGRIRPHAIDTSATGLHRLLFDPVWMQRTRRQPVATMSTNAAAVALGVKQEVAYAWVRRGLIVTVQGTTKEELGHRITAEALADFRRDYVAGTEVAKLLGTRARWVSVRLAASGVLPVSGPQVDGCRQFLFRRSEVQAHLLASAA
jgi:hypothetical protein